MHCRGVLRWLIAWLATGSAAALAAGTPTPSERYALPPPAASATVEAAALNRDAELDADRQRPRTAPGRYAVARPLAAMRATPGSAPRGGEWRDLPDGRVLWRVPVHVPGALSLSFTFARWFLPPGAQLVVRGDGQVRGPYTDADNTPSHRFTTPLVSGDRAQIEVLLPAAMKPFLALEPQAVYAGYRGLGVAGDKSLFNPSTGSGACNIDTVCPAGDDWRSEMNAVAVLTANGSYCSGQLVANTAGDRAPLLLTAYHCFNSSTAADDLVAYWQYQSPTCRVIGSADNALPVPSNDAVAQTGGASLLAANVDADTTLLRLRTTPPAAAQVSFTGWDRSTDGFTGSTTIHHPQADAKRITFAGVDIVADDTDYGASVAPGVHHWRVDHYDSGTTEPGSSGSGLLDRAHRIRGVLSGGAADCSVPDGNDLYGRLDAAWTGGGTPSTRVADWLDPAASGATRQDGQGVCAAPAVSLALSATSIKAGDRITATAAASGGTAPYTYAFDVDGDGATDSTDSTQSSIPVVYPGAFSGNVSVRVTDATGCTGTASTGLVVVAPDIEVAAAPVPAPVALCGGGDGTFQPGQRWRQQVVLSNTGNGASAAGFAVFAQDPATLAQTQLTLETPAVALPALQPGESTSFALDYAVDAATACASPVRIDLVGSGDANAFHATSTQVVARTLASTCAAVTTCPAQPPARRLDAGAYYDPVRPGSGLTLITQAAAAGADPLLFGVWFTGDATRQPTWYQLQTTLHGAQANSPLYRTGQTVPPTWPQGPGVIGSAQLTLVDDDRVAYTWQFGGQQGGALLLPVTSIASSIRIFYNPAESGWGVFDQMAQVAGPGAPPLLASFLYLYDGVGTPRWVQGNDPAYVAGNIVPVSLTRPTCPGCVWLDYHAGQKALGNLQYGGAASDATLSTNILFPPPLSGSWQRQQMPLVKLYP